MTTIKIRDVCERDIDLLMLEELVASSDFRSWFLSQIDVDQTSNLLEICRSVPTANGESDLELTLEGISGTVKVLIENKVDAGFQPNQPERYVERAKCYGETGKYCDVITVIMAPEVYFGNEIDNFGFDAKVTYESALAWFGGAPSIGNRKAYKLALLGGAIERGRAGWKPIPNPNASRFWESYWQHAEQRAPQLGMPVPKKVIPAGSHFIRFCPASLTSDVSLLHKVGYGHVDLQFTGMGNRLVDLERKYRSLLLPGMRIERAQMSAVVRLCVEPYTISATTFDVAERVILKGIESAATLLEWYQQSTGRQVRPQHETDGTD